MKKSIVVWKKSLSVLCAASLAVSSFLPGTVANAAEYAGSAVVSLGSVELSGETGNDDETKEKLFVRLVGSFESKMVGEEDIDAVSSATTVYYLPEDDHSVKLQAALASYAASMEEVAETDWHELSFYNQENGAVAVNEDPTKTKVVIEPECEGITGEYNIFTGDVTLSGVPQNAGFIFGSAINGQLILKAGATLGNARIISHTNYSARDDKK